MVQVNPLFHIADIDITNQPFELTSSAPFLCISFGIIDDDIVESAEYFNITLVQSSIDVEFLNDAASIVINDNDRKTCIDVEILLCKISYSFYFPL